MTAPRSSALRALRLLSQQHTATPTIRRTLHITGANSAQPANVSDRTSLYSTRSLADLKSECQKRALRTSGTQAELVERLANHDFLQSRAFSIAMRRINGSSQVEYVIGPDKITLDPIQTSVHSSPRPRRLTSSSHARQFNTSRAQKAVNDSSTVDFVYMPSMADIDAPAPRPDPRIPILPDSYSHHLQAPAPGSAPMKPQVYTVAGDGADVAASPMTEVVDNHAVDIDPFSLTEAVGKSRYGAQLQNQGSQEPGVMRELWSGFLDDLLGPKQQSQKQ
ncbi:SAP-domain-containing protein [Aspergillus terreus]|uniref:SAP-domain-containing protein n=1 Tax=Aspergillus terreus TaxID=33178 RepID=A0A5M3Z5V8_ASPTE|nr:hypothetical protein ATETN484_0007059300 [Aspergillus terreus]GFF16560.1 SAP-domain-containing protein [Aspergillus terreus]